MRWTRRTGPSDVRDGLSRLGGGGGATLPAGGDARVATSPAEDSAEAGAEHPA